MNISILHYAAPPIVGGVESTIYHHARLLDQAGYQISILAGRGTKFQDSITFVLIPEIDSQNPKVTNVGKQLAEAKITEDFTNLRDDLYDSLSSALKSTDILIVHNAITLHKNLALTAALKLLADQSKLRILAWCHDFAWQDKLYSPDLHPGYPWDLLKITWKGVEYVTVSEHRKQRLGELLCLAPESIDVIQPGVDFFRFNQLSELGQNFIIQNQLLHSEPIILLPARITRRKNIQFAIQVTSFIKKTYPQVSLVITGPPGPHNPKNIEYLESLLEIRSSLELESNVHFIYQLLGNGEIFNAPDELISELYRISDIVLFPSLREGFGIPVLEAGLARIPIFASDIPPVRESSSGMISLIDPKGDPKQAAEIIIAFLRSDQSYKFRRHVLANFTWQSIVEYKIIPLLERPDTI